MNPRPARFRAARTLCFLSLTFVAGMGLARTRKAAATSTGAPTPPPLLMGAAWYPEQWPEARWEKDLELMQQAHVHLVRLGEYTWARNEPSEGRYDFDWMERAINLAGKHGIFVVIGTPSQSPPAWLTQKYPQVLRTLQDGRRVKPGSRASFNFSDPTYRRLVREMDIRLAQRFGHNPYVIGWQIDNEYNFISYDDGTREQFQNWLHQKYGTLDAFNQRLDMAYWGLTVTRWDQIEIPGRNGNPGLMLDWKRFVTDTWRSYQKNQIDALRTAIDPRQKITTNLMGWFDGFDHYVITKDVDFTAWDDPLGHWANPFDPVHNAATNDLMRGLKQQNYWIMETTAGSNIAKGQMRAALWQDIGHGANTTSYWQWRDSLNGQEQNHKGILVGVDGTPSPEYSDIAQTADEYDRAGREVAGTNVSAQIAILQSYPSRWVINWQRENPNYNPIKEILSYYTPLHQLGYTIDIVSPHASLSKYKLVIAPGLNVLPQDVADNLTRYVKGGGNLVLGQRSGMKNWDNSRWPQRQPGPLAGLLGGRVEQYIALRAPVPVDGTWGANQDQLYAERLQITAPDVHTLMQYGVSNGWLDHQPAAITRSVGSGSITYIGIWMNPEGMKRAARWMVNAAGVQPDLPQVPPGVEVERRVGHGKNLLFFENFAAAPRSVTLDSAMHDVLSGDTVSSFTLPVYGVRILESAQ